MITKNYLKCFPRGENCVRNKNITLKTDITLQSKELEEDFWKYAYREKYPSITKYASTIVSDLHTYTNRFFHIRSYIKSSCESMRTY